MGLIKDGSISGILPSSEAFAVHYPGYPSSTDRAIDTLGGTHAILKARCSQSNKLELHFRPEDPYSHPVHGELQPCNNFLLKISKTKDGDARNKLGSIRMQEGSTSEHLKLEQNRPHPDSLETRQRVSQLESGHSAAPAEVDAQKPEDVEENLSADIVARVTEAYHFNGMVDYQHVLAVHADAARKQKRSWADVESEFEYAGLMDLDQEDLMILVPPLFSPKDVPEKVVLKPCVSLSLKKKQQAVVRQRWEIPRKVTWEKYIPEGSDQWKWQVAVCELFDERPIWIKHSLVDRLLDQGLKFADHMLRRLLFRAAYYFSNGPFLRFWIKKGYDPRKDPESRIYQRIDFRVPPSLRSYCDANVAAGLKHRWEDLCKFRIFPLKCQTSLQLFELEDDFIQQEITKPFNQEICSGATGWFSSRMLDTLRLRVAVRFLSVYPKAGAEALLKYAKERFEKSKKIQMCTKDLRPDEEVQRQVIRELVGKNDKEDPKNDEEEDDEADDEIEDVNVEDELETYEAFDLVGDDGIFSQQPSLYTNSDSISKNYLQMLFGSFPLNEAGGNQLQDDGENSDGEYQIYEQYSDGNYSEDDDD